MTRHSPRIALISVFLLGSFSIAQPNRDVRYVIEDRVEVRSGPSDSAEFYATNHLSRGESVEVVEEMPGGWLAIRPPRGSFSYVNTRFLRHVVPDLPTHVVTLDGVKVPVYVGSAVVNKRPSIIGSWVEPGAQVVSRGKPITDEDGSWMPIDSPARERRYVKASKVAKSRNNPTDQLVRTSGTESNVQSTFTPSLSKATITPTASSVGSTSTPQLWSQAEQAERRGELAEAIRLYALVGANAAQSQPELSAMALQRARYLQGAGTIPSTSARSTSSGIPTPVLVGRPTTTRGMPGYVDPPTPPPARTISSSNPPRLPASRSGTASWISTQGILRRAGRIVEGQQTYALDDPITLRPILYATPARGLDFTPYLNRIVTLSGHSVYRGDLRINYMTAVQLTPVQ